MQDYIFHSRRQARRRRRKMLVRLVLLLALLAAGVVAVTHLTERFTGVGQGPEEDRDLLPLPPIEETRPVSRHEPPSERPETKERNSTIVEATSPSTDAESAPATNPAEMASEGTSPPPVEAPSVAETPNPDTIATPQTEAEPQTVELTWKHHRIRSGDSLAKVFRRLELPPALLHRIVNSSETARGLSRVKPGQELRFGFDEDGELQALVLQQSRVRSLEIRRTESGFEAKQVELPLERRVTAVQGTILESLFVDGRKVGLTDAQVMELARIFGWDIDFALELREGDRFSVIFEEQYLDGEKLGNGPILAAEFVNKGTVYRAVRYTTSEGETDYYDPEGNAKRRAFIRTPVKFGRISSGFTRKRWHPVLKRWRSHKGVDYAAPTGTPVKATGNGTVTFIGRKGGYGKVIFLRHGGRYTTVYGHLSRFAKGLKTGSKVKQGQVIGYVGSTGLATGPHLHYEFRVNGVHRNPLTVKLPKSVRLPKSEMDRFRRTIQPMVAQLDALRARSMVASAADR